MPTTAISFNEGEVVKLVLEFLNNRDLNISMLSLERETGVINGRFSDDMLFMRQLILDGQWDDVIAFVQPLSSLESFDMKKFQYLITKHKYLELLCIKSEPGPYQSYEVTVDEVVKCLNSLETLCPTSEEYKNLCLLLTLGRLSDHIEYQNWNPTSARVECFKGIFPIVEKFLPVDMLDKRNESRATNSKGDRMLQLLVKGLLYESCVDFCHYKATSSEYDCKDVKLSSLLNGTGISDADLSLLSWLQAIPDDTFSCPFDQKNLKVDVRPLEKPSLEASWSEQILVTPIKPKTFPHSAIPMLRGRASDIMSRSLNPQFDGLTHGLNAGPKLSLGTAEIMSRSFAGFHLSPGTKKLMTTSIDKIFEDGKMIDTQSSVSLSDTSLSSQKVNSPQQGSQKPGISGSPPGTPNLSQAKTSTPISDKVTVKPGAPRRSMSPTRSQKQEKRDSDGSRSSTELYKVDHCKPVRPSLKKCLLGVTLPVVI